MKILDFLLGTLNELSRDSADPLLYARHEAIKWCALCFASAVICMVMAAFLEPDSAEAMSQWWLMYESYGFEALALLAIVGFAYFFWVSYQTYMHPEHFGHHDQE